MLGHERRGKEPPTLIREWLQRHKHRAFKKRKQVSCFFKAKTGHDVKAISLVTVSTKLKMELVEN